jgi:hypothetical protein
MAYTTYTKIQARVPNTKLDVSLVSEYIAEAEDWINAMTGTQFAPTISSASPKIYDTFPMSDSIVIDQTYQVITVESLLSRTEAGDTWAVVPATNYRVKPENNSPKTSIEFVGGFGAGYPIYFEGTQASVRVTARWGYSATVPSEITSIATRYVLEALRLDGIIDGRVKSEKLGDASVSYETRSSNSVLDELAKQLSQYKDWGDIRI